MAKELPYFRFTPQEWQNGDISLERYELRGIFIDVCSYYWVKDCSITIAMLEKRYSNDVGLLNELFELSILSLDENDVYVNISFLDEQFDILSEARKRRQEAGSKGGKQKSSNAKAKLKQCSSYKDKDKEKDNNKDNIFNDFWDKYHSITKKPKTDKDAAEKYFKKLSQAEKRKAIDNIEKYFNSLNDKKYCKKARTYLADKNFNDEFSKINNSGSKQTINDKLDTSEYNDDNFLVIPK